MCGDYYIGGRRFSSLSDLIGYYSYMSCLLKGEELISPVAPPEVGIQCKHLVLFINGKNDKFLKYIYKNNLLFGKPVEDRRRVRAILPYTKVPETDEIRSYDFMMLFSNIYTVYSLVSVRFFFFF